MAIDFVTLNEIQPAGCYFEEGNSATFNRRLFAGLFMLGGCLVGSSHANC